MIIHEPLTTLSTTSPNTVSWLNSTANDSSLFGFSEFNREDVLCRILTTTTTTTVAGIWDTATFAETFLKTLEQSDQAISRLKSITKWQKHRLDYQAVYSAYLLGAMNEEEFMKEADNYATEYQEKPISAVLDEIKEIQMLLDFEMSPSDFSDYLGIEQHVISNALSFSENESLTSEVASQLLHSRQHG